jgi:hypothetical protein
MKRVLPFLFFVTLAANVRAQAPQASWVWYPGDFDLWLSSKIQVLRTERGMFYPPFWRMDRHTPLVAFTKTVELDADETVEFRVEGRYYLTINGKYVYDQNITSVPLTKGKNNIRFLVYNTETPPAVWMKGKTVVTDKTWMVSRNTPATVSADSWIFDSPDNKPSDYRLATKPQTPVNISKRKKSALVDFGCETFGFFKLHGLYGFYFYIAQYISTLRPKNYRLVATLLSFWGRCSTFRIFFSAKDSIPGSVSRFPLFSRPLIRTFSHY